MTFTANSLLRSIATVGLMVTTGCASMVSKSVWPVTIKSTPVGAEAVVTDRQGNEVHKGKTPTTVKLRSSDGFFRPATYGIQLSLEGFETQKTSITAGINGWYWCNFGFGGLTGFMVVDAATGAMWKLPKEVAVKLQPVAAGR